MEMFIMDFIELCLKEFLEQFLRMIVDEFLKYLIRMKMLKINEQIGVGIIERFLREKIEKMCFFKDS